LGNGKVADQELVLFQTNPSLYKYKGILQRTASGNGSTVVFAARFHQAQRFFANLMTKRYNPSATALGLPVLVGRFGRMRPVFSGSLLPDATGFSVGRICHFGWIATNQRSGLLPNHKRNKQLSL
jgi:hypothetical protein